MRRLHPFVWGHVIGAVATGVVTGAFLDWTAVAIFPSVLAVNAAVSSLICWWWPGFTGRWWKLWLMATFINPMMLAAVAWSIDQWDCLISGRGGWSCFLAELGPLVAAACLPSPLIGLAARWWWSRRQA